MKSDLFTEMGDIFNPSHNQEHLKHKQPPKPGQRVNWKGNDACVRVVTLKSFYVDGVIKSSKYTSTIEDVEKLFDNAVFDAALLAKNAKGEVIVQRTKTVLYINYLGIPKSKLIDVMKTAEVF
jgi:hypothetical protein